MNEKKVKIFLMVFICMIMNIAQGMCSDCNICSHTTFVPRTMAQNDVLELALHEYYTYHARACGDCPPWLSVQVTAPYFFKSTERKKLARYLLPGCNDCISIAQNNTSDISSLWLQIAAPVNTPFLSTMCLRPTRTVIGGAIRLFFDFSSWFECDDCWSNNWWASVFIPIQQVRHNLHASQEILPGSGLPIQPPSFATPFDSFNNPTVEYGKIALKKLSKTGVDDICLRLGYDFVKDADKHAGFYGLVFIPTGSGTHAEFLFEPLVGSNHPGVGAGFNADSLVYNCGSTSIDAMIDVRFAHFFNHRETRSIDLFNGDWSRYILVATEAAPGTLQPGINYFTQEVNVKPGNFFEVWAALNFNVCDWHLEVGYDFWMRSKEKLKLADKDLGVGIADIAFNPATQCATSAHCARICSAVPDEAGAPVSDYPLFITVKNSQAINEQGVSLDGNNCNGSYCAQPNQCSYLNLNSAAHPRALSSTVYAAVSWDGCVCWDKPVMLGIGGQYEFAHRSSALSQYGVWLKTAINF